MAADGLPFYSLVFNTFGFYKMIIVTHLSTFIVLKYKVYIVKQVTKSHVI